MRARPISLDVLVAELADRVASMPGDAWVRVVVDGAPVAGPGRLADRLVDPLRLRGRAVVRVSADDFLRPASLRLEYGRTDPDAFYDDWLDVPALRREVLGPLERGRTGKVLPALWDNAADRAWRVPYVMVPVGGVVVLDGGLLLGRGLPFEVSVHLWMSDRALARRTPEEWKWTLPAYARYEREVGPARTADVVVKVDDPHHPALVHKIAE